MKWKAWLPTILLSVLALALLGGVAIVGGLDPEEDRSAQLQAQLNDERERERTLAGQIADQMLVAEALESELEELEAQRQALSGKKEEFDDLLARWKTLQAEAEARQSQADGMRLWECALAPNYDRRCLTYLQGGNNVTSTIGGFLGGIFGKLVSNNINNLTQEDIGVILTMMSEFTDELNAAIQPGEQALARLEANAFVLDACYDPEVTGAGVRTQVQAMESLKGGQNEEADDLHAVAWAAAMMEHYLPVYDVFLSESTENSNYLAHAKQCLSRFQEALSKRGETIEGQLTQEERDGLCRRTVLWHQRIGTVIQNSQIWLETSTMTTSLLSSGHKVTTTWRDPNKTMLSATDPKGGQTAYYGFDASGEPFCVVRGEMLVLFDWQTKDGTALYTTCSAEDTAGLYKFAAFLRDEKNGFRRAQYEENQRVY